MVEGWVVSIVVLIVINIAVAAYGYGRLSQKVSDLVRRITRLEKAYNGNLKDGFHKTVQCCDDPDDNKKDSK